MKPDATRTVHDPQRLHEDLVRTWSRRPGWRGWLADVNHSAIGLRFMLLAAAYFAIGGVLAMLIRVQLAHPKAAFVGPEIYNQLFTMHGSVMMFLFAIPMLEGLALYLLPKLLGARDMAFPRLSAFGFWCYALGGLVLLVAMLAGVAPDGGWFMYTPLSDRTHTPGINADVWLLGVTFVEVSALCAAVEIVVSILKLRAPGLSLARMPLFAWYLLGTASMMLVGFPPLILGSILLEVQRAFDWAFFDPARGGDPLLWQHLFWLFGHPEVYIIFLPAAGAVSTMVGTFARRAVIGYPLLVAAIWAMVFLSFGLWVHHMFTVGIPHLALAFFSAASMLVVLPTAMQVFAWIGTLWAGTPRWSLPMLYVAGFIVTFVIGGLTGVMLAAVPFNWQAHDTAFVTAHLHYVLIGGFVFPMLAAVTYWMPHFTGRRAIRPLGTAAFWLVFLGTHGTFLVMHLTGLLGMPRRVSTYLPNPEWITLNLVSSVGGFVLAAGFALFAADLALQVFLGRRSRLNPWRAGTLEWAMPLPAPAYNFASLPPLLAGQSAERMAPATLDAWRRRLAAGEGWLPGAPRGVRESVVVDAASGAPRAVAVLPGNSLLPFATACVVGVFFLLMLGKAYGLAPLALVTIAWVALRWVGWDARVPMREIAVADDVRLPVANAQRESLGWWGSAVLLVADGTFFASLLFAAAYLAVVAPGAGTAMAQPPGLPGLAGAALAALAGGALLAGAWPARGRGAMPGRWLSTAALAVLAAAAVAQLATLAGPPTAHARHAVQAALAAYLLAHVAICVLLRLGARRAARLADGARPAPAAVALQWQRFTGGCALLAAAAWWLARA